jgi:cell division protease FtsH
MAMDKRFAIFAGVVIGVLLVVAGLTFWQSQGEFALAKPVAYSTFLDNLERGEIKSVTIDGTRILGTLKSNTLFQTYATNDPNLVRDLRAKSVAIAVQPPRDPGPSPLATLMGLLPILILGGIMIWFMMRQPGSGSRGNPLGKSKARLLADDHARITFEDVAGVDEAKEDLQEIVDFLKDPHKFEKLGGRIPRGVLLVGPPGTGKTLLARAIAGEANVPFFTISGSDFVEMFVGIGASRVRDMFEQAKKTAPCIVFMDEIDAVGRKRGAGLGQGNDEREQTLNALLVEMDGFSANAGVILIAATNRPDVLDPALLRPGRFDREIVVSKPDIVGREHILKVHARKVPLAAGVDLKAVARRTPGFSGADLMNLVNEAALLAVRRGRESVGMRELDDAKDRVTMGAERRTFVMTEAEKRLTAYREGGRAIVALHVPAADPVHKATIIPRGRSMGSVKQVPEDDQLSTTMEQMKARLAVLLGGRAAEEMTFGRDKITSGAAADLEEATKLARNMVTRWGLSESLGTVAYGENQDEVFLGNSVTRHQNVSEEDAQKISAEIRKLIDGALAEARRILAAHRAELDTVARGLLQYESLSGAEIADLIAGRQPVREIANEPAPKAMVAPATSTAPAPAATARRTGGARPSEPPDDKRPARQTKLEKSV